MDSGIGVEQAESNSVRQVAVAAFVFAIGALALFGLVAATGDGAPVRALVADPGPGPSATVAGIATEREAVGPDDSIQIDRILAGEPVVSSASTVYNGPRYGAAPSAATIGPPPTAPRAPVDRSPARRPARAPSQSTGTPVSPTVAPTAPVPPIVPGGGELLAPNETTTTAQTTSTEPATSTTAMESTSTSTAVTTTETTALPQPTTSLVTREPENSDPENSDPETPDAEMPDVNP